ncbi:NAD regulator [Methylosinus sp. PW1]|uniref:NUDIX hydrolase n=1 Tax=Methylosinus sp. PW1 TaxID=107636 RepID=UPI00055DF72D|nr:NAD regulator [Methylosinus sp. PW1]
MTSFEPRREPPASSRDSEGPLPVAIGLTAAIVAAQEDEPLILTVAATGEDARAALPSGPFDPVRHRTFEIGLRAWVAEQTGMSLGYVEQLYTFGDRGRHARAGDRDPHVVSVGYLALTRIAEEQAEEIRGFRSWYEFFPWEDWRGGRPEAMEATILPGLSAWVEEAPDALSSSGLRRRDRVNLLFRPQGRGFDEENALERYELLYEAGLVEEAWRDGREAALKRGMKPPPLGAPMQHDHRRILATAMGRLRAKMKYRPVIFELMPPAFTLTELQRTVEAIAGRHLHKQNFRRLVETSAAVEPTGEVSLKTGGRPAALFHFRRNVLQERPAPGLRVGIRG